MIHPLEPGYRQEYGETGNYIKHLFGERAWMKRYTARRQHSVQKSQLTPPPPPPPSTLPAQPHSFVHDITSSAETWSKNQWIDNDNDTDEDDKKASPRKVISQAVASTMTEDDHSVQLTKSLHTVFQWTMAHFMEIICFIFIAVLFWELRQIRKSLSALSKQAVFASKTKTHHSGSVLGTS